MRAWVDSGEDVLRDLGPRLDDLHAATRTQLTARRTWLQAWVDTRPHWQPVAVCVEAPDGSLAAVALLATQTRGPATRIVLLGHGASDVLALPARHRAAAETLGTEVADYLRTTRRPWHLLARHLETPAAGGGSAPVLEALARRTGGRAAPGDVSPVLVADRGPSLDSYVSGNHRRGISRLRNRLTREGMAQETSHVEDPEKLASLMPEVERVLRARDRELGRTSAVDVAHERDFLRAVVARHAQRGEVRLTCLHVDGELAAYVLCFLDGNVVRMWNPRFDPALSRYSPGKIAMDASVRYALESGAAAYDFMRGAERYKESYANHHEIATDLSVASGGVVRATESIALKVRDRIRAMEADEGTRGTSWATSARSIISRIR